jgi:hypothetical protein
MFSPIVTVFRSAVLVSCPDEHTGGRADDSVGPAKAACTLHRCGKRPEESSEPDRVRLSQAGRVRRRLRARPYAGRPASTARAGTRPPPLVAISSRPREGVSPRRNRSFLRRVRVQGRVWGAERRRRRRVRAEAWGDR